MTRTPKVPAVEAIKKRLARLSGGCVRAARRAGAWRFSFGEVQDAWLKSEVLSSARRKPLLWAMVRYGTAVAGVVAAFVLQSGLSDWVGGKLPPFILFYPALVIIALLGGRGPGLLATALTVVVVDLWLMPPSGRFLTGNASDRLALALFALNGGLIITAAELYHRQSRKAADYAREVTAGIERQRMARAVQEERDRSSSICPYRRANHQTMTHKVLIVEDEALVAQDLAEKLQELGYEVGGITERGEHAVTMAILKKPIDVERLLEALSRAQQAPSLA